MREPRLSGSGLQTRRYLGIELAGGRSDRTAIAALEYYPREKKVFLLDSFDRLGAEPDSSADESLIALLRELSPGVSRAGINVPIGLPPCTTCTRKQCPLPAACTVSSVKWMSALTRKIARQGKRAPIRAKEFTPYTQRPIELWVRYQVLPLLPEGAQFEIDETLGGNKAPLTSRFQFLQRHLGTLPWVEVWPKLSVATLAPTLSLSKRTLSHHRHLEEGAQARSQILEALAESQGIFFYERDFKKLSTSLTAFDAFFCAYTALLFDLNSCAAAPRDFPAGSDWIAYPALPRESLRSLKGRAP